MIGDRQDFVSRLRTVLPSRWFSDRSPNLDALLTGVASAWSTAYALVTYVQAQARVATASGIFLDIAAYDYLGGGLPRRAGEADSPYSTRIRTNLLAPRATRKSLVEALTNLTGRTPIVFEPRNASDTGGYNTTLGYNAAGGYGSLNMPYQFLLTVFRPNAMPISNAGGYNGGPGGYGDAPMFYGNTSTFAGTVSDTEIYAMITGVIPTNSIAWTQISN